MATLNESTTSGPQPQTPQGVLLTVDYTPAGYGPDVVAQNNPGQAAQAVVDPTQQSATAPLVVAPSAGGGNDSDNFLASSLVVAGTTDNSSDTPTDVFNPSQNAAQHGSAGKSLAPQHE
jgi:hypothetical protein